MMSKQLTLRMEDDLPLREVVYRTLRQGILDGTLQGGERLKEIDLAGTLGVSRTPVREAIRKLEKEGLVRILPRRGALVAPNASGDEQDVWEVELALRELALVRACRCGAFFPTETRQDALQGLFQETQGKVRKALEAGDADACARFEETFFDDRDLGLCGGWEPHLDTATETSAVNLLPAFLSGCISSEQASSGQPSSLADGAPAWQEPPSCPASLGSPSPPIGHLGQPPSSQPLRPLQSLGPTDHRSQPSSLVASSTSQSCLMWPWAWGPAPDL